MRAYNWPGQTYLFWLLGKTAGWGRPRVFQAVDASFVLALGALLVAWSRRRLGGALPGLSAYLIFVWHYLNLDVAGVGAARLARAVLRGRRPAGDADQARPRMGRSCSRRGRRPWR